jgi:hypothetical protein
LKILLQISGPKLQIFSLLTQDFFYKIFIKHYFYRVICLKLECFLLQIKLK